MHQRTNACSTAAAVPKLQKRVRESLLQKVCEREQEREARERERERRSQKMHLTPARMHPRMASPERSPYSRRYRRRRRRRRRRRSSDASRRRNFFRSCNFLQISD